MQCYAVRMLFSFHNSLQMSYFAYFHSVIKYTVFFFFGGGGGSTDRDMVLILQKRSLRITAGVVIYNFMQKAV